MQTLISWHMFFEIPPETVTAISSHATKLDFSPLKRIFPPNVHSFFPEHFFYPRSIHHRWVETWKQEGNCQEIYGLFLKKKRFSFLRKGSRKNAAFLSNNISLLSAVLIRVFLRPKHFTGLLQRKEAYFSIWHRVVLVLSAFFCSLLCG